MTARSSFLTGHVSLEERRRLPIGVFDSGVGGLTVLAAIRRVLPDEGLIYLGDTARLPYGTKSSLTIERYSVQATEKLVEKGIKLLVVACNTATAAALPRLREAYPHIPVVGVVEPGARAAVAASQSGDIVVLATESTINNQAYQKAIRALQPEATVTGIACTLFVALAEEGWMSGEIVEAATRRYLAPVLGSGPVCRDFDCLVLGCTHFPPMARAIRAVIGPKPVIVDSAATTAEAVRATLADLGLLRGKDQGEVSLRCMTTDAPSRFARVGSLFLGETIREDDLELVVL